MAERAAILISRQSLRPSGTTPWVAGALKAIRWVKANDLSLDSSIGMQTWELVTALASHDRIPLTLYILSRFNQSNSSDEITRQFALAADHVEFIPVQATEKDSKEQELTVRDTQVVSDADVLLPISVRPGGHMHRLIGEARAQGKRIVDEFAVPWKQPREEIISHFDRCSINPEIDTYSSDHLIHWTRTPHGQWPGERAIDYYLEMSHCERFPRCAFDTLRRIVRDGRLLASPRHMPSNIPTVAFSALAPRDLIPLMRWRARYAEMSFEPYGIGIRKESASKLGIRPVIYYEGAKPAEFETSSWLCQSIGTRTDWRQEAEYRHRGDLTLDISPHDIVLFCRTAEEAAQLRQEFGIASVNLFL